MTDEKLLGAWTGVAHLYPPLWNAKIVRSCGDVVLTVRSPAPEPATEGSWSTVRFTREMWREFMAKVNEINKVAEAADYMDGIL
jgi:hypothetical protein